MYERKPIDILRHEAGHMVVAKVLGFKTGELEYNERHAGAHITIEPMLPDLAAVSAYVRRRATVLYAGVLAEALKDSKIVNEKALEFIRSEENVADYKRVSELIHVAAGIERSEGNHQGVLNAIGNEVWNRAATLVEKYAEQIVMLSKEWRQALGGLAKITISAEEISKIQCFKEIEAGCEIEQ